MTTADLVWLLLHFGSHNDTPGCYGFVYKELLACDDHDFELDKHFLVVKFLPLPLLLLEAEPSPRDSSDTDHPPRKS